MLLTLCAESEIFMADCEKNESGEVIVYTDTAGPGLWLATCGGEQ
jgi:hypothetical protein